MFGLGVGPTKVELTWEGDRLSFAWMDQRPPEFREPVSPRPDIIRAVGLDPAAVDADRAADRRDLVRQRLSVYSGAHARRR